MIDIQTLILALGIGNVGFAVLMAGYTHGAAPDTAIRLWIGSKLVLGGSQLLGWLQPAPWLVGVDALGAVAGMALEVTAYAAFFGYDRWKRALIPISVLALLVMVAARANDPGYVRLMGLACVWVALYAFQTSYILLHPRTGRPSLLQRLIATNNALFAVGMLLGAWDALMHPSRALGSSALHGFAGLAGYLLMILNGVGFLLLCKQKDDEQMALLATTDCLTGLVNRRAFFERAESARQLAARLRKPMALLMLDIDHFKQINDRFGHGTGDEALKVFADTARATLREHDIMGRLGGEEFALALPGTDLDGAVQAAERLRLAVNAAPLITSGSDYAMTVSVGVVVVDAKEEITAALARADRALYMAKSEGRNRVVVGAPLLRRA